MPAEAILPLTRLDPPQAAEVATPRRAPAASVEPAQVQAAHAALISGVGESTWWRLHSAGKVPRPNKLGGKTLWVVAELREWIAAGCPGRREWEAARAARKNR